MSYKYLKEHPRSTDESWKRMIVLGAMKSSVQLYPEVEFHISTYNRCRILNEH